MLIVQASEFTIERCNVTIAGTALKAAWVDVFVSDVFIHVNQGLHVAMLTVCCSCNNNSKSVPVSPVEECL